MSSEEMVVGKIYIIRLKFQVMKIEVLEITKTSMYLHNLDNNVKFRTSKDDFDCNYFVLEEIDPSFGKIIDPIKKKITSHYDDTNKMFPLGDEKFLESLPEEELDLHQLSLMDAVDDFKFDKNGV